MSVTQEEHDELKARVKQLEESLAQLVDELVVDEAELYLRDRESWEDEAAIVRERHAAKVREQ